MRPTSTYFTKATMLVAVLVMLLSACKKGDEISPAQQQFNTEMETLQAIFKSYGVSADKVDARMTTKETNIQSVDFSALELTTMDERLYTIRIQKTIDLRNNQLDMEVINTVKTKFPKVEVLVSGNPPYEQDIELETLEKLGVSADSERVVKNAEGFVSELDLSGMDKVELDSAIFEFPYLTKLNLANNDLQFHHFQTLKNSIDGIELNFEGNPIYEISMTEISRFQEYLDFNEVKANAEEVLTFYTNDNSVSDEELPEGSSLGYIATIDLSAQNIADLALPTEDFVVLKTDVLEIDLSNSSFGLDAMMDEKRVGAIYPTNVEGNEILGAAIEAYIKVQAPLMEDYDNLKDAGADYYKTEFKKLPYPFSTLTQPDAFSFFYVRTAYNNGIFDVQLNLLQNSVKNVIPCKFIDRAIIGLVELYANGELNTDEYINLFNQRGTPLDISIQCFKNAKFNNEFNKLDTEISFGNPNTLGLTFGIMVDTAIVSNQAFNGISCPYFGLGIRDALIFKDDVINISVYGETFILSAREVYIENDIERPEIHFIDGNGQYSESKKAKSVIINNLHEASMPVDVYIDLINFPALEKLVLQTKGNIYLDEELLNNIEEVEIISKNINK